MGHMDQDYMVTSSDTDPETPFINQGLTLTRLNAIATLEACQDRQEKLEIAEQVLICCFYTCQPPDRVSVIRKLSFGNTDTLRCFFLTDGLIYDCLTVCVSIEAKDVAQIRALVRKQTRQDGAAAAWDRAFVHGKI